MSDNLEEKILEEVGELKKLKGDDNWNSVRNEQLFTKRIVQTSRGDRVNIVPRTLKHCEGLQASRGMSITSAETISDVKEKFEQGMTLTSLDKFRMEELDVTIDELNRSIKSKQLENLKLVEELNPKVVCEFGFRFPRIVHEYVANRGFESGYGYEISQINVDIANHMGYDARLCDLNALDCEYDLSTVDVVCMYHVLEHLMEPLRVLKDIKAKMKHGAILHIEIPVEGNNPQFNYGHLFGFHLNDLPAFLAESGFFVIKNQTNVTFDGLVTERSTCMKIQ